VQRKKQLWASVLVVIFALYYANISFFYHSHIINGFTISHSHIHDTEHAKTGTHSEGELLSIALPSYFQSLPAALCSTFIGLFILFVTIIQVASGQQPVSVVFINSYLRGPPALF